MDELIGEEIFVVVSEEDTVTEMSFYEDPETVTEHLMLIDGLEEPDTKVFHGVLTRADAIPSDIKDKNCYIIVIHMEYTYHNAQGSIFMSDCDDDVDLLARDVEEVVSGQTADVFISEIEDVYILYGYEIELGLCVNAESIDEEVIATCKTIANEVKEVREKYLNN